MVAYIVEKYPLEGLGYKISPHKLCLKQVADILGHTTSQITEMHYVKKDTSRLSGVTDGFEI